MKSNIKHLLGKYKVVPTYDNLKSKFKDKGKSPQNSIDVHINRHPDNKNSEDLKDIKSEDIKKHNEEEAYSYVQSLNNEDHYFDGDILTSEEMIARANQSDQKKIGKYITKKQNAIASNLKTLAGGAPNKRFWQTKNYHKKKVRKHYTKTRGNIISAAAAAAAELKGFNGNDVGALAKGANALVSKATYGAIDKKTKKREDNKLKADKFLASYNK